MYKVGFGTMGTGHSSSKNSVALYTYDIYGHPTERVVWRQWPLAQYKKEVQFIDIIVAI